MSDLYKVSGKMIKVDETTLTTDAQGALETIRATNNEAIAGTDTNKALTPASGKALVDDVVNARLTNALIYRGEWAITTSTTDYSGLNSFRPIKAGDYFRITGTGPATIDGVEYNPQDSIIFKQAVSATTTITNSMFDHLDHTDSSDTVYLNETQTLTNKTLSASDNTISNLTTSNLASGVLKTAMSGTPSDTAILSEKAVSDAITASSPHVDDVTIEKYKAQAGDDYDTLRVKDGGIGISKIAPSALTTLSGETNTTIPTYAKVDNMIANAQIEATYAGEIVQVSKTFATTGNHVEFTEQCQTKAYISVYQDRVYVYPSEYTLDNDGMGITFTQNIASGTVVEVNYFRGIPNSKVDELIAAAETVNPDNYAEVDLSNLSATGEAHFQAPITGAATSITSSDLTASKALVSDANGKVAASSITSTELGYVSGVTSAIQTQINGKANTDLSNSPYTTNRILEIPQNIKLELNNGTLTLKSGSKVYVPNGAGVFDEIVLSSNLTFSSQLNDTRLYVINRNGLTTARLPASLCFSGDTVPTSFGQYGLWYDTANNVVKYTENSGSTWTSGYSLPAFIATGDGSSVTSIDQVFNGFGYIGSTVFVLPGVKVQCPDGRNENGYLKTIIESVTTIKTRTVSSSESGVKSIILSSTSVFLNSISNQIFDVSDNYYKYNGSKQTEIVSLGQVYIESGRIITFTPYIVDSVANSNMSNISSAGRSFISDMSCPSTTYEDWTLLATNNDYDIPANGWLTLVKQSSALGQYIVLFENTNTALASYGILWSSSSSQNIGVTVRVRKGQKIRVSYTTGGATQYFRFFYDVGEV